MVGNLIIQASIPRGVFLAGVLSDPGGLGVLPGTHMQFKNAVAEGAAGLTYQVYDPPAHTDGAPDLIAVLTNNLANGWQDPEKAFHDGDYVTLYCPLPGELCNIRVGHAGTGTHDAIAVGDVLMIDDGTGVAIADSSGLRKPWRAVEHVTDVVAMTSGGTLVSCMATGV